MKKHLAFSSDTYLLHRAELSQLKKAPNYIPHNKQIILLLNFESNHPDTILSGFSGLQNYRQDYVRVRLAYYAPNVWLGLIIQLIKPFKRNSVHMNVSVYKTKLSALLAQHLTRGTRNRENAYQLNNKKWYVPESERAKRYDELFNSLKKGYDFKYPLLIGLNRHLGYKDQLLQGHHRIGICRELGIEEVSVSFWTYPQSVLHHFLKHKT